MQWYQYWGNPILATGILAFTMHEVSTQHFSRDQTEKGPSPARLRQGGGLLGAIAASDRKPTNPYIRSLQVIYFGRCIPWLIIDQFPGTFGKYKLQEVSHSFRPAHGPPSTSRLA